MARTTYYVADLQELSNKAKRRFEETFGEPVPFPSPEECEAELEKSKERFRKFFAHFKVKKSKKGGNHVHEAGIDLLEPDSDDEGIASTSA